ncbi:proline racemase family protein [Mesorhizobium australicum]|uniref:proline racemase family protein n=1 Tax=Mesorhizobium australicum TaxID=536018 RepID=UPI003335A96D
MSPIQQRCRQADNRLRIDCQIESEVDVGGRAGIVPVISESAWIPGIHQDMLDPTDPFPTGNRVPDTWPLENVI